MACRGTDARETICGQGAIRTPAPLGGLIETQREGRSAAPPHQNRTFDVQRIKQPPQVTDMPLRAWWGLSSEVPLSASE